MTTTQHSTLSEAVIPQVAGHPTLARVSDRLERLTGGIVIPDESVLRSGLLGHALHPVLTDLPLGCWLSASLLDLLGGEESRSAAQKLVGVGVLSAIPTAVAGLADWTSLRGDDRRIATAHAIGNDVALVLFLGSLSARRRGRHRLGAALTLAGNGLTAASGFLGGYLALERATARPAGA